MGLITPIGSNLDEFWRALIEGRSGARDVRSFDTSALPNHRGCEIDEATLQHPLGASPHGRCTQLAVLAIAEALADSGIEPAHLAGDRSAVVVGTTMGEVTQFEEDRAAHPDDEADDDDVASLVRRPLDTMARTLAEIHGVRGPVVSVPAACAAGTYAIGVAASLVQRGAVDRAVAVGCEAFSRLAFVGFSRMRAMSADACRPFSRGRPGLLLGEGAGAVLVEADRVARRRGAQARGCVVGFGLSCDAFHITGPDPQGRGAARATRDALARAGLSASRVDYVNAHGTGTPLNDKTESLALNDVFGADTPRVPVSSIKALTGHMMGAAGAVEAIASLLAMAEGVIPPTWNWVERDPDCDIDCVPNEPRTRRLRHVVSNSYAFGGNNASLLFSAVEG
jgi:3-oxoacyl-[acyl-carrier-protein] synthase II